VKDKLSKVRDKKAKGRADVGGEPGFNHSALSSQPETGIIVEGEFRGGDVKVSVVKDDSEPLFHGQQ